MCTKLRSGVLVGLPPGHRRQAVKCPRAPFSWKRSAESDKKSAMRLVPRSIVVCAVIPRGKEATESHQ